MPRRCEFITLAGGGSAIICHSGPRIVKCAYCNKPHSVLCDFEIATGKTCDKPLCRDHAEHHPEKGDIDYCPEHRAVNI